MRLYEYRPFIEASRYYFYSLVKNELELKFTVGADHSDETETQEKYVYLADGKEKEITKGELSSYFTDAVNFEWIKINNE